MKEKKLSCLNCKVVFIALVLFVTAVTGWTQDHDLTMTPASDFNSAISADRKSPDIKIGADFGDTSVTDIVRRGVPNDIYARFTINGMLDHTIVSGSVEINFYWRSAAGIGDIPPPLSDSSFWTHIGNIFVTYVPADGPFAATRVWPSDFPSVTTKSVTWTPPESGSYFHVAAQVDYLPAAGVTDDNLGDNAAVSLYGSQSGLLDIVLLHDVSGSMGYYTYNGYNYMKHAIARASFFISGMNSVDRLAVVAFSSIYTGGSEDIWPTSLPEIRPATSDNKTYAAAAISGLSASGATPMGQGLERAIQILTTASGPVRKRVILLLSDGYENYGTPRACGSGDPAAPCVGGSLLSELQAGNIRVFTIALGTSAWTECLECLANQSGGQWYGTPGPGIDLAQVYLDMQQAYSADDLYRVDRGVSGSGDDTYSTYFEGKDDVLYFMLAWDDLDAHLDLKLYPPGSRRLGRTKDYRGDGYLIIQVENPRKGTWKYEVTGDEGKDYLVAVRSNRVGVRLGMDVKSERMVGGPIEIRAKLAYGKKPVTNARLTAAVQVPVGPSLETTIQQLYREHILKYKTSPRDPKVLKKNPDLSPRAAFIHKIAGDKLESLIKMRTINVPLRHIGKGIYSGVLKEAYTTTAGVYKVIVKCSGREYHRTFSKQVRLQPGKIDYERSFGEILIMKAADQRPVWLIRVNAVDRFGNAITSPSLFERIKLKVSGASLFRKPVIAFGGFQQKLTVTPKQKPALDMLIIDGRQVKIVK